LWNEKDEKGQSEAIRKRREEPGIARRRTLRAKRGKAAAVREKKEKGNVNKGQRGGSPGKKKRKKWNSAGSGTEILFRSRIVRS